MITYYNCEQGSNAWHELRCGRITASKFKEVVSAKSTLGYKGLINTCIGEILSQTIEESYSNDNMQRGIELEPDAANSYELENEVELKEIGFLTNSNLHEEYVGVSPDRLIYDDGLLEIKCPLMKTHIGYLRAGKLPNEYKWQVQGQLLISERKYCDFMSHYPNLPTFKIRIYPDEKMQLELKQRLDDAVAEIKEAVSNLQKL